jgi:diguanylate cyclase (GGDEF)-like protein
MGWQAVGIAVLASALAYDLYLRARQRRSTGPPGAEELQGLENWRTFYDLAGVEFERARRHGRPFTLAYFDVDDFEEMKARFGDELAEGMLWALAECARRSLRSTDVIGRLGSDAFALLLPETDSDAAGAVVQKFQRELHGASHDTGLPLTISGGVVTCLQPVESLEAVIGAADRLLAGARDAGMGTVWSEVIAPQPLEGFEPARLRRRHRQPPAFDVTMPRPRGRPRDD